MSLPGGRDGRASRRKGGAAIVGSWRLVGALILVLTVVACGSQDRRAADPNPHLVEAAPPAPAAPTTTTAPPNLSLVAHAQVPSISVYDSPGAAQPSRSLDHPGAFYEPLVFLVKEQQPDWLNVYLPIRPNGSTGWVHSSEVSLTSHDFRIVVELGAHRLTVWRGNEMFHQEPVGVGTSRTPTPPGLYYVRFLYPSADEVDRRKYGPYALVLSGYSEVFEHFMGGNGELGIHGTNNPGDLGRNVSNGCVRMSNQGVTKLAQALPDGGVPVEIVP